MFFFLLYQIGVCVCYTLSKKVYDVRVYKIADCDILENMSQTFLKYLYTFCMVSYIKRYQNIIEPK